MNMTTNTTDDLMMRVQWDDKDLKQGVDNAIKLLTDMGKKVEDIEKKGSDSLSKIAEAGKKGFESLGKKTEDLGKNVSSAFSTIGDAVGKLNFDDLGKAVEGVSSHFTLFGRIGEEALGRIANAVVDVGAHIAGMVNDLTLKPIMSGFEEYGLLMDSTQVILANTGEELSTVDDALEELNHYADKTIYNFSHMTQAIGKFTAAGVNLDDSVAAIQGLSNLSAMVGVDAAQNSRAMDALSQALSTGAMKQRQWLRFEATGGLAGAVFRDNLIATAEELGYFARTWTDATGKSIEGAELMAEAQTSFRNTLNYGWVDQDVLLATLAKFTDETTDLGQQAFKAATEVRTWNKLWDALQEAVQSSWSETFKYIFGDYEEGTKFWTAINDEVSKYIGMIGDSRNDMLEIWSGSGGRQDVLDGLAAGWNTLKKSITPVIDTLKENFNWLNLDAISKATILDEASASFKSWAESLKVSDEYANKISNITQAILTRVTVFKEFLEGGGLRNITNQLSNVGKIILNVANTVSLAFMKKLGTNFAGISKVMLNISNAVTKLFKKWEDFSRSQQFANIVTDISGLLTPIKKIVELLKGADFSRLITIFDGGLKIALSLLASVGRAVDNVFGKVKSYSQNNLITKFLGSLGLNTSYENKIDSFFDKISKGFRTIEKFFTSSTTGNKITAIVEGYITGWQGILEIIGQVVSYVNDKLIGGSEGFVGALDKVLDIGVGISDWIKNLEEVINKYDLIYKTLDLIGTFFSPFVDLTKDAVSMLLAAFENLTGIDIPWFDANELSMDDTNKSIGEAKINLEELAKSFNDHYDVIKAKVEKFSNTVVAPLRATVNLIGAILSTAIEAISQAFEFVQTKIFGLNTDALTGTAEKLTDGLNLLTSWVTEIKNVITENNTVYKTLDTIVTFVTPFLVFFKDTIYSILGAIEAITGIDIPWINDPPTVWEDTAENVDATKNSIARFLESIDFDKLKQQAETVSTTIVGALRKVLDAVDTIVDILDENDIFQKLATPFRLIYEHISNIDFSPIVSILSDVFRIAIYVVTAFSTAIEDVFKFTGETSTISRLLSVIADVVHSIKETWATDWGFGVLRRAFSGILSIVRIILDVIFQVVEAGLDFYDKIKPSLDAVWSVAMTIFGGVIQYLGDTFRWLERMIRHTNLIKNAISVVSNFLAPIFNSVVGLGKAVGVVYEQITGFKITDIFSNLATTLGGAKGNFISFGDFLSEKINALGELAESGGNRIAQGIGNFALDLVTGEDVFSKTMEYWGGKIDEFKAWRDNKLQTLFNDDGSINYEAAGTSFVNYAFIAIEKLKQIISDIVTNLIGAFTDFFENPSMSNLPGIPSIGAILGTITGKFWLFVTNTVDDFFSGLFSTTDKVEVDGVEDATEEAAGEAMTSVSEGIQKGIEEALNNPESLNGKSIFSIVLDNLKAWAEKTFGDIIPFNQIEQALSSSTGFFDGIFNAILTFFKGDYESITIDGVIERLNTLVLIFGESKFFSLLGNLSKVLNQTAGSLKKVKKYIKPVFKELQETIKAIGKGFTDTGKSAQGMFKEVGGAFKKFGEAATKVSEHSVQISNVVSKNLSKALTKISKHWSKTVAKFAKGWNTIAKGINKFLGDAGKSLRDIGKGTKRYLTGEAINAAATGLLKFAVAVAIIAAAIWAIAQVPTEDLIKGGVVIGIIIAALLVVAAIIVHLTKKESALTEASDGVTGLGLLFSSFKESLDDFLGGITDGLKKMGNAAIMFAFAAIVMAVVHGIKTLADLDWDDLVKGVGGMVVAMLAIAASIAIIFASAKTDKSQTAMTARQVAAMYIMLSAIGKLTDAILEIAKLDFEKAIQGMLAISAAMLVFSASMAIIFASAKTDKGDTAMSVTQVLAMLVMVLAVKTLADSVVKLGSMEERLWQGVAAMAVLTAVFDIMLACTKLTKDVNVWPIIGLVAAVWVLTDSVVKLGRMNQEHLVTATACLDSLMGFFALMEFATGQLELSKVLGAILLMGITVGMVAGVLYLLEENVGDYEKFKAIADGLSETILSLTAALGGCAAIGQYLNQGAWDGILLLDGFIADLLVVLGAIGTVVTFIDDNFNGAATQVLEKGAETLEFVGKAFGDFVGSIIGGIVEKTLEYAGSAIESFGTNLSNFADNAGPFFDKMSSVNSDTFEGLDHLAGAMVKLTANDLMNNLNIFKNEDNPYKKFADALGLIGPAMKTYSDEVKDVKTKKIKSVTAALGQIVDVAQKIPNQGGKIADIFGDNTLSQFATGLTDFAGPFSAYLNTVSLTEFNEDQVSKAISLADATVEFAKKIPKEGGIFGDVFGEGDLSTFATDLEAFVGPFTGYLEQVSAASFDEETIKKSTELAEGIAGFASKITDIQALNALGEADIGPLEQFGKDLVAFAPHFVDYLGQISGANFNSEVVANSNAFADSLAGLSDKVSGKAGLLTSLFVGDNSLSGIGEGLDTFSGAIASFSTNLQGVKWEDIDKAIAMLNDIGTAAEDHSEGLNTLAFQTFDDGLVSISNIVATLRSNFKTALSDDTLSSAVESDATSLGASIQNGIASGFEDANVNKQGYGPGGITSALNGAMLDAIDSAKLILGISDSSNGQSSTFFLLASNVITSIISGIEDQQDELNSSAETSAEGVVKAYTDEALNQMSIKHSKIRLSVLTKAREAMNLLASTVITVLNYNEPSMSDTAYNVLFNVASQGAFAIAQKYDDFFNVGTYVTNGFINGINSRAQAAVDAVANLGNATVTTLANAIDAQSPSRATFELGKFFNSGFINAIVSGGSDVLTAVKDTFTKPVDAISALLNGEIEYNPTIRPVVDMSDVRRTSGYMDNLFGEKSLALTENAMLMSEQNRANKAKEAANSIYNDKRVVSAINGLRGDVNGMQAAMSNMGLYIDGDALVGRITDRMDRNLAANQIRRKRGI